MAAITEALKLHQTGRFEEAEAAYDAILAAEPEHADALHLKGVILMQRGDARGAVKLISQAIVVRPGDALYYTNLAAGLYQLNLPDRAIEYAYRALAIDAKRHEAHLVIGQALIRKQAPEPALEAFQSAHRLQPADRKAIGGVLESLQSLGRAQELVGFVETLTLPLDDTIRIIQARAFRDLGQMDQSLQALEACRFKSEHDWQANMLKLRLERKEPDLAVPHGQALLDYKNKLAHERCPSATIASARIAWPPEVPPFRPNSVEAPERNVVCFSLWGDNPKYTYNAVLNAKLVPQYYRGWSARFYVDDSVPAEIVQALADYGARVLRVGNDGREYLKLFWRFLATDDPSVERFVCRDCDAVVNKREAAAVAEWLASGKRFHLMRDHPEHAELIMAGMWGGIAGLLPRLSERAVEYYETHEPKWRWIDQDFLRDCIWPVIKDDCLVHDDFYVMGGDCRRFPSDAVLPQGEHVGGYRPRFAAERGG